VFYLVSIPILGIVIVAYLIVATIGWGMFLDGDVVGSTLAMGTEIILRGSDIFLLFGIIALFLDTLKVRDAELPARVLSCVTFAVALGCLLFYGPAATSTFLLLTAMSLGPALVAALRL
jgi:hypothetical protein